jgi:hypothetical protein
MGMGSFLILEFNNTVAGFALERSPGIGKLEQEQLNVGGGLLAATPLLGGRARCGKRGERIEEQDASVEIPRPPSSDSLRDDTW